MSCESSTPAQSECRVLLEHSVVRVLPPFLQSVHFAETPLPSILTDSRWTFLTEAERNVEPVFTLIMQLSKLYPKLKKKAFLNTSKGYSVIARMDNEELHYLSESRLLLFLFVAQHFCARLSYSREHSARTKNPLVSNIRRGISVLYHYYYHHLCRQDEACILRALGDDAKDRIPADEDFLTTFSICFPHVSQLPTVAIRVPWTECLKHVKHKNVLLVNGYALLSYLHVAGWAAQKWKMHFRQWMQHDESIIDDWWKCRQEGSNEQLRYKLSTGDFFNDDDFERSPLIERRLGTTYKSFVARAKKEITLLVQSSSSSSSSSQYVMKPHNSFKVYKDCMPPCVLKLYSQHFLDGTHMKNAERLTFVSWCVKVGMPEHVLQEEWEAMCRQDSRVDERMLKSLKTEVGNIFKRFSSNTEHRFNGCPKMTNYCSFTDIEDIVSRKSKCIAQTCENVTQFWQENPEKWSPISASNNRLRRYQ